MFYALLMCCALVGQDAPAAVGHSGDLATYESANAKAGENADAHVQLALWCEAHGLSAQRVKQLALAVMYDPSHALRAGSWDWSALEGNGESPTKSPSRFRTIRTARD